jgi:hypothetical protein
MDFATFERKKRYIIIGLTIIIASAALIGGLLFIYRPGPEVILPAAIRKQLNFSVYLSDDLPGNYHLVKDSFSYDQGVLIFKTEDGAGDTIAFTEQKKPQGFDFANFYTQQLSDAKNLDHVPFPSVTGKALQGHNNVLSVMANDTWLLISSQSPLTQDDMTQIARSLKLFHTS